MNYRHEQKANLHSTEEQFTPESDFIRLNSMIFESLPLNNLHNLSYIRVPTFIIYYAFEFCLQVLCKSLSKKIKLSVRCEKRYGCFVCVGVVKTSKTNFLKSQLPQTEVSYRSLLTNKLML